MPYETLAYGPPISYGCGDIAASYGGGLAVTSSSPFAPTGLMVNSENAIDGTVAVIGNLPFLGSVAMEGVFPTAGAGSVSYGCGDGYIGIISELPGYTSAIAGPVGYVDYGMSPYGIPIGSCGYGPMY